MAERGKSFLASSEAKGRDDSGGSAENRLASEEQKLLAVQIGKLVQHLEKFNLAEYMNLLNNPRRYIVVNFFGGLFRGFGIALGMTMLGALVLWLLQRLVRLNLPIIGDFIADLVRIVLTYL